MVIALNFGSNCFQTKQRGSMVCVVQAILLLAVVLGVQSAVATFEDNYETNLREYSLENSEPDCNDTYSDAEKCPEFKENGECENNPVFMLKFCAKTCDSCGCKDKNYDDCWEKAGKGQCITDATVKEACPISCANCEDRCLDNVGENNGYYGAECRVWSLCGYCEPDYIDHQGVLEKCPASCGECKDNTIDPEVCQDWLNEYQCSMIKYKGKCYSHLESLLGCMETCGACKWQANRDDNECGFEQCDGWKNEGYCETSPCLMNRFCGTICRDGGSGQCESIYPYKFG